MNADQEGFRAFVTARHGALLRAAYLLTGDHHEAEDLLQEALVRAAGVWERIAERPEPYVRRILYHQSISRWRRRRVDEVPWDGPDELPRATGAGPDDGSDEQVDRMLLAQALARLTPKQRTVLVLRYYEDLTETQTALVMGVRVGTVKSQTRHALMRLRQLAPDLVASLGELAHR